jgi:hypothetical protein
MFLYDSFNHPLNDYENLNNFVINYLKNRIAFENKFNFIINEDNVIDFGCGVNHSFIFTQSNFLKKFY